MNEMRNGQEGRGRSSLLRSYWKAYSWMYLCVGIASILGGIAAIVLANSGAHGHPVPEMRAVGGILIVFGIWRIILAISKLRKLS